ncbi:MAG: hypothetical protein ACLRR5_08350 [Bilophila wadsworthia]
MQSPEFVERLHKLNLVPGYLTARMPRIREEEPSATPNHKGLMAK